MEHLARLLLDFGRAPGNYPVRLREPRVLFDEFDVIAQWALDRLPESLQDRATDLKAAAVLFIQRACFASDNTYYQVLGLQPHAYPPEELRARYRTMIRLAHPDMGLKGLPANAASLVNQANKVLSDTAQRLQYDEQLSRQKAAHTVTPTPFLSQVRVVPNHHGIATRLLLFKAQHPRILRAFALFGSVSIPVAALLIWAAQESNDSRMLVVATREPADRPAMAVHQMAETASSMTVSNPAPQSGDTATARISAAKKPAALENTLAVVAVLPQASIQGSEIAANRIAKSELPASPAHEIVVMPSVEQPQAVSVAVQPTGVASPAPANASPAGLAASSTVAVQSSATQPVTVIPVSTTTPATQQVVPTQQPTPPVWNVDAEGARMYLSALMTRLENPPEAQRINAYLKSMKVKGSLLTPALKALSERSDFQVRPSHWTESTRSGALNIQATVLVQPKVPEKDSVQVLQFRVLAEFHGTAEGTMLAVLDFKESN